MTEDGPERRRLQFSLRRMLIWTSLLAFWCGIWKPLGFGRPFVFLTVWAVVVATVRVFWSPKAALLVSMGIAGIMSASSLNLAHDAYFSAALGFAAFGVSFGWLIYIQVTGLLAVVDWADRFIEGKTRKTPND